MPVPAPGIRGQTQLDDLISFDGTITAGGTAQLVLPQQPRRLSLEICNVSNGALALGIGPAQAHATLTGAAVTSVTIDNAGIGYTVAPKVVFLGGLTAGDHLNSPSHPAVAHATLTGTGVGSIVIDDGGAGYVVAPLVYLMNPLPTLGGGAFLPATAAGLILPAGYIWSTSGMLVVPTSAVALWGATTGQPFAVKVGGLV